MGIWLGKLWRLAASAAMDLQHCWTGSKANCWCSGAKSRGSYVNNFCWKLVRKNKYSIWIMKWILFVSVRPRQNKLVKEQAAESNPILQLRKRLSNIWPVILQLYGPVIRLQTYIHLMESWSIHKFLLQYPRPHNPLEFLLMEQLCWASTIRQFSQYLWRVVWKQKTWSRPQLFFFSSVIG